MAKQQTPPTTTPPKPDRNQKPGKASGKTTTGKGGAPPAGKTRR